MKKEANINLRLPEDLKERAETVATNCGSTLSLLLRLMLEKYVQMVEENNGVVVMPPEFKKLHEDERLIFAGKKSGNHKEKKS